MSDPTQASRPGPGDAASGSAPDAMPAGLDAERIRQGLWAWMAILLAGGATSAAFGHAEGALLFAGAGAFALAQASDAANLLEGYRRFVDAELPPASLQGRLLRGAAGAVVPLVGAAFYAVMGVYAWRGAGAGFAALWCAGAVLVCGALSARPLADAVSRACFRGPPGRTRRLAARLVVLLLLLPPPAVRLMPVLMGNVVRSGTPLASAPGLVAQLLGEVAVALAGVGLFVRRDWGAVRDRLGLTALRPAHLLVVLAGVAGAFGLNMGTEWIERHLFPSLWQADAAITRLIVGDLSLATALLLGASAGVGEEVVVRGALQPRFGIVPSAVVFACAHVQYSWFGMLTVGLLGVLLGVIRRRTNTTVAILVHVAYDILAAVTTPPG